MALDSDHILHPQLLVRRDVAGTLHGRWCGTLSGAETATMRRSPSPGPTSRSGGPAADKRRPGTAPDANKRGHAQLRPAELEQDLHRVLHDVRVAVED